MNYRRIIINPSDRFFTDYTVRAVPKSSVRIHVILFIATFLTTTGVGSIMAGGDPFSGLGGFARGLPFSVTLLAILGIHEFGHYFVARYWRINVTLPYFIPFPFLPIGTFGAVIKMKSSIPNRKALIDVGAAGPIAGFVVAVAASIIGLGMSEIAPLGLSGNHETIIFGESIIFKFLAWIVLGSLPENADVMLHPVAFAGWIGLFVTALNLIPIGQLDGGHIMFSLSPKIHELLRRLRIPILLLMGLTFWVGWYVWAFILLLVGRSHPYPDYMNPTIGLSRKIIAILAIIIFIISFMPVPVKMG